MNTKILYEKLCTLQRLKLRSVKIDSTILEAKKLSEENLAIQQQNFDKRQKTKTQKPKFMVSDSREQKTEKIKSLATYERRITDKIKAITDKELWLNQDAIKLDRFRLPIKTENLPIFDSGGHRIGYQYEAVINLDALNTEYKKLINTKHSDKKTKTKEEIREYNRLQKARRRKELKEKVIFDSKIAEWMQERQKSHIPDSILNSILSRINQKETLPLTHTFIDQKPINAQKCLTTYELIHYLKDIEFAKTQLIESNQKTDKIRNWTRDYWNSEVFDKKTNSVISIKNLINRKPKKFTCMDIEGNIFYV